MAPNIVVGRDARINSESFSEFCNRQAKVFRGSLPGFVVEEQETGQLNERTATRMIFTWISGAGPLRQEAVFIDAGQGVVVNFTASAAENDFAAHRKVFYDQLALLQIETTD